MRALELHLKPLGNNSAALSTVQDKVHSTLVRLVSLMKTEIARHAHIAEDTQKPALAVESFQVLKKTCHAFEKMFAAHTTLITDENAKSNLHIYSQGTRVIMAYYRRTVAELSENWITSPILLGETEMTADTKPVAKIEPASRQTDQTILKTQEQPAAASSKNAPQTKVQKISASNIAVGVGTSLAALGLAGVLIVQSSKQTEDSLGETKPAAAAAKAPKSPHVAFPKASDKYPPKLLPDITALPDFAEKAKRFAYQLKTDPAFKKKYVSGDWLVWDRKLAEAFAGQRVSDEESIEIASAFQQHLGIKNGTGQFGPKSRNLTLAKYGESLRTSPLPEKNDLREPEGMLKTPWGEMIPMPVAENETEERLFAQLGTPYARLRCSQFIWNGVYRPHGVKMPEIEPDGEFSTAIMRKHVTPISDISGVIRGDLVQYDSSLRPIKQTRPIKHMMVNILQKNGYMLVIDSSSDLGKVAFRWIRIDRLLEKNPQFGRPNIPNAEQKAAVSRKIAESKPESSIKSAFAKAWSFIRHPLG